MLEPMGTLSQTEGAREARARRKAKRLGLRVEKVRSWNRWLGNDGFVVTSAHTGNLVAPAGGAQTPLTLDELEQDLDLEENAQEFQQELAEGES